MYTFVIVCACFVTSVGSYAVEPAIPVEQRPGSDPSQAGSSNNRTLRPWFPEPEADSLVGFARAISCATESNPIRYNNYGCYCGWGGSGTPVDPIDNCCRIHDNCYGKCEKSGCWPKLSPYSLTCFHANHTPVCENSENTECNACCCNCDVAAAICFRDNDHHYRSGKAMCK